jgi:hypothetical protein
MAVETLIEEERAQYNNTIVYLNERIAELEFAQEDWGWTRLGGEASYEFSREFLRRIVARSRLFYLQNPLVHRAVTLQADYIFAQGVSVQGTNDIVNKVIQEFLDDPTNKKELTSHMAQLELERTLLLDGNLFFVLFTDKQVSGRVKVRSISLDEITDIVTNPDDVSEVWYYRREWNSVDDGGTSTFNVVYYPDINYMPQTLARLPQQYKGKPILWDAPIVHVSVGALKKSKFGAPETYSALNWAKAHEKMLADWATIISTYAKFAFQLTTPGNKASVVAAKTRLESSIGSGSVVETNPSPVVGSIFARQKDGATLEPVKTSGATTSARDARELRIMVAAAMGLPDPMLSGEVDVGNLATAKTLDRPTELKFRSRQKLWEEVFKQILSWVVRWSIESGRGLLKPYVRTTIDNRGEKEYKPKRDPKTGKPIDLHVEVVFPPILERTIQERIDAVIGAITLNGKQFAVDSPELKKLTIRLMLQALGLSDVDELVDQIFKDIEDSDLKDDNQNGEPTPEPDSVPEQSEIRI